MIRHIQLTKILLLPPKYEIIMIAIKGIAKRLPLLFANAFKSVKRATTFAVAIVGRAKTIFFSTTEKRP